MKKFCALAIAAYSALFGGFVLAKTNPDAPEATLEKNIIKILPQLALRSVRETPIKGLYEVYTVNGEIFYSTVDAKYVLQGQLFRSEGDGHFTNLSDEAMSVERLAVLNKLASSDLVVFPAAGEVKETLTVFTDPSCGYCQKFHQEVPALQKMGVTVKYVAWPRAGADSPAGKTLHSVWCSSDRQSAMNAAKNRQSLPSPAKGCDSKIAQQLKVGEQMGVTGTPAVFNSKGAQIGGYFSAEDFAKKMSLK